MRVQSATVVALADPIIAAAAGIGAALIAALVAYVVSRRNLRMEDRTSRLILTLMRHGNRRYRSFDIIQRRIGGFSDDELRQHLVRAGAVRFYLPWKEVYTRGLSEEMLTELPEDALMAPVEVWSLLDQPFWGWRSTLATSVFRSVKDERNRPADFWPLDPERELGFLREAEDPLPPRPHSLALPYMLLIYGLAAAVPIFVVLDQPTVALYAAIAFVAITYAYTHLLSRLLKLVRRCSLIIRKKIRRLPKRLRIGSRSRIWSSG